MRSTSYLLLILSEVSDGKFCFTEVRWFVERVALGVVCCLDVLTGLVGVVGLVVVAGLAVKVVTLYIASVSDKHKENCCNVFTFSAAGTLV